ncbi:FecR family protein [Pedobacter endophyticus]|uniref:FecR family protein n=1 Tax=Pedobacter endophyticus TaxID=2789740 RepID=A0A7S9KYR8_9SPHI|nr:FecR family protein [Pedobacter endophyticus]QPH39310.1 FecR family protein [Pedobacter endophyticus]
MNVSEELLNRYFENKCTPEERLLVNRYLKEIEEFPEHLVIKEDWDKITDAPLPAEKSTAMFKRIKAETFAKKPKIKWLQISAAAALIAVIITIGIIIFSQSKPDNMIRNATNTVKEPVSFNWKSVVNYTEKTQLITLPDQSVIKIYPGGELRYAVPFVNANREVFLKGKSFFQVAKDKEHPFIVYANGVSTTALGTSFTITAIKQGKFVDVVLHTGKVRVKSIDSTSNQSFSKILLPGNELIYNVAKHEAKVIMPKKEMLAELKFTQVPLATVFEQLEQHYNISITYSVKDIEKISFTGDIDTKQPVHHILKEITSLNQLKQTRTAKGYFIEK